MNIVSIQQELTELHRSRVSLPLSMVSWLSRWCVPFVIALSSLFPVGIVRRRTHRRLLRHPLLFILIRALSRQVLGLLQGVSVGVDRVGGCRETTCKGVG